MVLMLQRAGAESLGQVPLQEGKAQQQRQAHHHRCRHQH
jgi:hypothetical protein